MMTSSPRRNRRGPGTAGWALRGAAAGAAGTTALNAVTYLDMAVRGRGSSSTPEKTVEELAHRLHTSVPGEGETRQNRLQGLGPLTGILSGVGIGLLAGLVRATGRRPGPLAGTLLTAVGAMIGTSGPMTALGITDPRTWPAGAWVSDVVPHLAYAAVVHSSLDGFARG